MRRQTSKIITFAILTFSLPQVPFSNAETIHLKSGNKRFPVSINFPIVPQTGQTSNPALPNSIVYRFTAQDDDKSVAYAVTISDIPKDLGLIPRDTAQMMINQSLDTQIGIVDAVLGVKGKVIETNSEPFAGYPSKYLEIVRQTTPRLFGIYRGIFVDRLLVTVWTTGLDTENNRSQAATFIQSLKITQ